MAVRPVSSVRAVAAESVALAPLAGAVNVTVALGTTLPPTSVTWTMSAAANVPPKPALWLLPETIATFLAAPAVLVSVNVTGAADVAETLTV